ncbi:hypothetical protein NE236_27650 [Actinoallomurus purpureus]|uniref:hypothetical protein n=1 Tax=Actinoallomurus purpureus TaxID=478114 RepID=UPI002093B8FD|nr:hypothetical protein [Actinoallomurus purpureus]MCO6008755.1 hypothetical protein [Actinoallomurus purpureus]
MVIPPESDQNKSVDFGRDRKLRLLVELCRELSGSGLYVGLSDARPALSVRAGLTGSRLWIQVEGGSFVWRRTDQVRHGADDPAGAAAQITEYLAGRPDGRP